MKLSIVIASIGRPCLAQALESLRGQGLTSEDQVLIMSDGKYDDCWRIAAQFQDLPLCVVGINGPNHDFGHTPRNWSKNYISGEYAMYLDDDNEYTAGAIASVKKCISEHGIGIYLFRAQLSNGTAVWHDQNVRLGNVDTGIIVHPTNVRLGRWGKTYSGDFDFIRDTVNLNPQLQVFWIPTIILNKCYEFVAPLDIVQSSDAYLDPHQKVLLFSLIYGLRPKNCLEIGTFEGGSAKLICSAMERVGWGRLICIDPNPRIAPYVLKSLSRRTTIIKGRSPEQISHAHELLDGNMFDFVFIDGDHSTKAVIEDTRGVLPYLAPNGYILYDDAHNEPVRLGIEASLAEYKCLLDCGMLSTNVKEEIWGGFRLLRYVAVAPSNCPKL